ncbi:MAG: radical SAM protein [Deltaproteobacteria bacterium]|nr:radical SAM protein [Deltaproteobacteria bacterium]
MTTVPYGARSSALAMLEALAKKHPVPLAAIVQLTRRCNLGCRHCFQVERTGSELGTDEWKLVLRRLADAGVLFLTFTGGEPLLRRDFVELVREARALAFAIKLKTNGLLLDGATCEALAAAAVMEIHFSFYSADAERHDRVTGLAGSHARTLAAARRMRDLGARVLLNCALQADTFDGYGAVIEFAEAEAMDWSFDPGIQVQEDGCSRPADHRLAPGQLERLYADPRLALPPEADDVPEKLPVPVCRVGQAMVAVAPNGDVWPCLSLLEPLGNLVESPLERIWVGNPRLERFSRICWSDLPECRGCELLGFCVRCHANALHEDGDLLGPSRLACAGARARARAAGRLPGRPDDSGLAPEGESRRLPFAGGAAEMAGEFTIRPRRLEEGQR